VEQVAKTVKVQTVDPEVFYLAPWETYEPTTTGVVMKDARKFVGQTETRSEPGTVRLVPWHRIEWVDERGLD
jgi:hypothetical protein